MPIIIFVSDAVELGPAPSQALREHRYTVSVDSKQLTMEGFEHLVPGWNSRVAHPYNIPIEAGIRSEIERLRGAHYLVAVLHREYDYDGLFEQIFLDAGFVDPMEAVQHARQVRERHCHTTLTEHPDWFRLVVPSHVWPSREAAGDRLLCLLPQKFGDGTGFNSREIYTAVLPIDPVRPLSAGLFQLLDKTPELHAYFRKVGETRV
jgi:hypothetical protein